VELASDEGARVASHRSGAHDRLGVLLIVTSAIGIPKARAAQRLIGGARPLVASAYLQREQALIVEGRQALEQITTTAPGHPQHARSV
jgi:hypothetical protein